MNAPQQGVEFARLSVRRVRLPAENRLLSYGCNSSSTEVLKKSFSIKTLRLQFMVHFTLLVLPTRPSAELPLSVQPDLTNMLIVRKVFGYLGSWRL